MSSKPSDILLQAALYPPTETSTTDGVSSERPAVPKPEVPAIIAKPEMINHPAHYGGEDNPYEAIKVIEAYSMGFNLGNATKYVLRNGKKPGVSAADDLKKAIWYINREIENMEKNK